MTAQQDIGKDLSKYFLCGFAFQQMKWSKLQYNCNCGYRFQGIPPVYKCDYCYNTYWTMANGFKATFCHYSNWDDQRVKTFETGGGQSQNLREFMCPQGTYAKKGAARMGRELQTDTGFVGMQLVCSGSDGTSNYKIQDEYKHALTSPSTNPDRTFISGLQIKYQPKGKLTGISLFFERMAIITSMSIKYISVGTLSPKKKIVEAAYFGNPSTNVTDYSLKFNKTYEYVSTWNNLLEHVRGYTVKEGQGLKAPRLNSTETGTYELNYRENTQHFRFDTEIKTILVPISTQLISMQGRTVINATAYIEQLQLSQAYEITLTFGDIVTGKKITEKLVKGIYTGSMISSIKLILTTDLMKNIYDPSLYYTYFPSGQIDGTQYKWTTNYGGWTGSNSNVDVPQGYWLVGIELRCGYNIDAITFEFTSNDKDLITRGQYGGNGGTAFPNFRANYLNGEWITKINIWYDSSVILGMEIITNKGTKSSLCGRSIGSFIGFDAKWYKRATVNSYPMLYNYRAEYMP